MEFRLQWWGSHVGNAREPEEAKMKWTMITVAAMGLATDAVNRLFSNDNPLLRLGRDLGMGAISRLPALRRRFIAEAAGIAGDLPRLMR